MTVGSLPRSDGRECWIFRAAGPEELFGVHGDAIAGALEPGEPLLRLVYLPIWDATATPFGQPVEPASHALAVTGRRFVLSINPHRRGRPPRVVEVPFDRLLAVEWGESLLSGWAALHHVSGGRPAALVWMFRSTGGRHHVADALRASRDRFAGRDGSCIASPAAASGLAPDLAPVVLPLLLDGERLEHRLPTREVWQGGRGRRAPGRGRRRPVCLSAGGLALATPHALLLAERAPAEHRHALDCGTRCLALAWSAVSALSLAPRPGGGEERWLHLTACRAGVSWSRWLAPGIPADAAEPFLAAVAPLLVPSART
jgi:hypothetical protein